MRDRYEAREMHWPTLIGAVVLILFVAGIIAAARNDWMNAKRVNTDAWRNLSQRGVPVPSLAVWLQWKDRDRINALAALPEFTEESPDAAP